MAFDNLEGRVLMGVAVKKGEDDLVLIFSGEAPLVVAVEGDCCSHSYWHEVIGAASCYGGVITGTRQLNLPEPDQGGHECLQAYGYAVDTTLGSVRFVFRNESNGYYGGWANDVKGVRELDPSQYVAVETNDWTA